MRPRVFPVFLGLLTACGGSAPTLEPPERVAESSASFRVIDGGVRADPTLEETLRPYREQVRARVAEVLAVSPTRLVKARPESALGALVADAILEAGRALADHPVHVALVNDGGLRAPLPAGEVTLGHIYELMPFENTVTLLELSGRHLQALAQEVAASGGEPVAGLTLVIEGPDARAGDVRVQGAPIDPDGRYWLATFDFIANGGGGFRSLSAPIAREDYTLLARDGIADHVRRLGTLSDARPLRVTVGEAR